MKTELTDFIKNPKLKKLMENYIHITYEMSATDEELVNEYNYLLRTNQIHLIFECEQITEYAKFAGVPVDQA
ncbi:hypothetical protein [Yeosuana marina]|uniref:hypothetical protein n=1 Tax=Yeosuana marina TaxID=1565536 RepID=UPI0030EB508D|tara:strand:+ start:353 stop:568 length:216 start_codon:yes stop_codon:yes gene_type:complete